MAEDKDKMRERLRKHGQDATGKELDFSVMSDREYEDWICAFAASERALEREEMLKVNDVSWHRADQQRDASGKLTTLALALDAIAGNGCDCGEDEPGTCLACRCEAALREMFAKVDSQAAQLDELRGLIRDAAKVGQQAAGGKASFTFDEFMAKVDEICAAIKRPQPQSADRATRMFPVLNQQNCRPSERKWMPREVPWSFVETFREQAKVNHDQTLERLAERGGLAPEEMWLAAHGKRIREMKLIGEQEAIDWLCEVTGIKKPVTAERSEGRE